MLGGAVGSRFCHSHAVALVWPVTGGGGQRQMADVVPCLRVLLVIRLVLLRTERVLRCEAKCRWGVLGSFLVEYGVYGVLVCTQHAKQVGLWACGQCR